ncbi:DUF6688 family protein [Virgibacillus pantothenticus]|uniref:DUF6688 family protein n=1 Tax=Virgibacillus pantothenticus TaxID=1473 RepID=UPI002E250602
MYGHYTKGINIGKTNKNWASTRIALPVNRQLLLANAFENIFKTYTPFLHQIVRKYYVVYSYPLSRTYPFQMVGGYRLFTRETHWNGCFYCAR